MFNIILNKRLGSAFRRLCTNRRSYLALLQYHIIGIFLRLCWLVALRRMDVMMTLQHAKSSFSTLQASHKSSTFENRRAQCKTMMSIH